eukprot:3676584-Prymnesium_polylepis.1
MSAAPRRSAVIGPACVTRSAWTDPHRRRADEDGSFLAQVVDAMEIPPGRGGHARQSPALPGGFRPGDTHA